jgi:hypothetical protein
VSYHKTLNIGYKKRHGHIKKEGRVRILVIKKQRACLNVQGRGKGRRGRREERGMRLRWKKEEREREREGKGESEGKQLFRYSIQNNYLISI